MKKQHDLASSVLELNFINLWKRALPYIQNERFETIELFLDNHRAGGAVIALILEMNTNANFKDLRPKYVSIDDLDAWLMTK